VKVKNEKSHTIFMSWIVLARSIFPRLAEISHTPMTQQPALLFSVILRSPSAMLRINSTTKNLFLNYCFAGRRN
jgi:hypothetical protein